MNNERRIKLLLALRKYPEKALKLTSRSSPVPRPGAGFFAFRAALRLDRSPGGP